MAIRRFVLDQPRIRAVANADLDVVITLREAVQTESIDDVSSTVPYLGDPIDLTLFTNLRTQIRAQKMSGSSNVTDFEGDNTPRATGSVVIYGDGRDGQLRMRVSAARLWAMQQARVTGCVFDIIGMDANGVTWSLITSGAFELVWGVTPPFTESATSPDAAPEDIYDAPENFDVLG